MTFSFRLSAIRKKISILLLIILSACASSPIEETLEFQHSQAGTQIADVRLTATVEAARAKTTLAFIDNQLNRANQQEQFLEATLIARGTDPSFISQNLAQLGGVIPILPTPTLAPFTILSPAPLNNNPSVLQTQEVSAPSTPLNAQVRDLVMAAGVDNNDCATGQTSQFSLANERIYVVGIGNGIPEGTTIRSRWYRDAEEVLSFDFAPEDAIEDECFWFFIDKTDIPFTAGNWSVVIEVGGVAVNTGLPFTITE